MQDGIESMPECAAEWVAAGRRVALATVVSTWGSAPRPVGSQLVIDAEGAMAGSVSGGCVEGAVVAEAQAMLAKSDGAGAGRMLHFGVADEDAFSVGLACGGEIAIWLELVSDPVARGAGLPLSVLHQIVEARAARSPLTHMIDTQSGSHRVVLGAEVSHLSEDGIFHHAHLPSFRLFVIGAVHIAQALVPMARILGHEVQVIDPRPAFTAAERFPGEEILGDWPDEALDAAKLDARSAVVTLTHDPKLDDPAILAALRAETCYLGCLGSTRTHAKRLERLRAQEIPEDDLARIHAPVGLSIGARGAGEIAVSILAQLTQVLRQSPLAETPRSDPSLAAPVARDTQT